MFSSVCSELFSLWLYFGFFLQRQVSLYSKKRNRIRKGLFARLPPNTEQELCYLLSMAYSNCPMSLLGINGTAFHHSKPSKTKTPKHQHLLQGEVGLKVSIYLLTYIVSSFTSRVQHVAGQRKSTGIVGTQYIALLPKTPCFCFHLALSKKAVSPADTVYQTEKAFPDSPGNTHQQPVTDPDVVPSMAWLTRFRGSLCPPSSGLCHTVNTTSSERQRPQQSVCGQTPTNCPVCSCNTEWPKVLGRSVHLEILSLCSDQQGRLWDK